MAVLVEGISVIIKAEAIIACYPGGWEAFEATAPNSTLYAENELMRIGFMTPDDTLAFVESLTAYGIEYVKNVKAMDIVVADQQRRFAVPCDWAEYGSINLGNDPKKKVSVYRRIPSKCHEIFRWLEI
jgi:hypothetical protein